MDRWADGAVKLTADIGGGGGGRLVLSSGNGEEVLRRRFGFSLSACASHALAVALSQDDRKNLPGCVAWVEVSFSETAVRGAGFPTSLWGTPLFALDCK